MIIATTEMTPIAFFLLLSAAALFYMYIRDNR